MFRLNRNERSHWSGNGVHVESELVFMIGRNMHKALGIKMGVPYFQIRQFFEAVGGVWFSSNYALYGDMSQRVMTTLEGMVPTVEVYSVDKSKLYSADA
ncbi:hypothetical protein NUITMVA2_10590 [Aeromonas caviae]|nr:hypothetical protein [Aeromonas caviae]BDC85702.1 hypothetical protein NUITMVA2_10590 [Aeromonas caviae]